MPTCSKSHTKWKVNTPTCSKSHTKWKVNTPTCSKSHAKWKVNTPKCGQSHAKWKVNMPKWNTLQNDKFKFQTVAHARKMVPAKKTASFYFFWCLFVFYWSRRKGFLTFSLHFCFCWSLFVFFDLFVMFCLISICFLDPLAIIPNTLLVCECLTWLENWLIKCNQSTTLQCHMVKLKFSAHDSARISQCHT